MCMRELVLAHMRNLITAHMRNWTAHMRNTYFMCHVGCVMSCDGLRKTRRKYAQPVG